MWLVYFCFKVLPSKDPEIENLQAVYKVGDAINATCSNGPSKPAPILTWYINDERVSFMGCIASN